MEGLESLLAGGELNDPDEDCARGIDGGPLRGGGILGHCNSEGVERGYREADEDAPHENSIVRCDVLEGARRVFKSAIVAELIGTANDLLEDGQEDQGYDQTPESL